MHTTIDPARHDRKNTPANSSPAGQRWARVSFEKFYDRSKSFFTIGEWYKNVFFFKLSLADFLQFW